MFEVNMTWTVYRDAPTVLFRGEVIGLPDDYLKRCATFRAIAKPFLARDARPLPFWLDPGMLHDQERIGRLRVEWRLADTNDPINSHELHFFLWR
jgi:hypothetical protein